MLYLLIQDIHVVTLHELLLYLLQVKLIKKTTQIIATQVKIFFA